MNDSTLYIVSTPIGNYDDLTIRALNVLKDSDFIICEEYKEAARLLNYFNINKELFALNEHNEKEASEELISKIKQSKFVSIISDCGTPIFSDPGAYLVNLAIENGIKVVPVPGPSSILAALVGSGLNLDKFHYYGWLSPKKEIRRKQLQELKVRKYTTVIMDTPYRLKTLLEDIVNVLGENVQTVLAYELTTANEKFIRGTAKEVLNEVIEKNLKGEFVLLLDRTEKNKYNLK
jgi:16S rRNA (cytidine1402-2'-O)-methyltransferase